MNYLTCDLSNDYIFWDKIKSQTLFLPFYDFFLMDNPTFSWYCLSSTWEVNVRWFWRYANCHQGKYCRDKSLLNSCPKVSDLWLKTKLYSKFQTCIQIFMLDFFYVVFINMTVVKTKSTPSLFRLGQEEFDNTYSVVWHTQPEKVNQSLQSLYKWLQI